MKRRIRLTESDLRRIVNNSVKRVLREWEEEEDYFDPTYLIDDICDEFGDGPVVITGTLGLWDGKHNIRPVECEDIRSAIMKCIGSDGQLMDEDDLTFDGIDVHVKSHHHDGTNEFTISTAVIPQF